MTDLKIRGLPDSVVMALRLHAKLRSRSLEAELRAILVSAVAPPERRMLGRALMQIGLYADVADFPLGASRRRVLVPRQKRAADAEAAGDDPA